MFVLVSMIIQSPIKDKEPVIARLNYDAIKYFCIWERQHEKKPSGTKIYLKFSDEIIYIEEKVFDFEIKCKQAYEEKIKMERNAIVELNKYNLEIDKQTGRNTGCKFKESGYSSCKNDEFDTF